MSAGLPIIVKARCRHLYCNSTMPTWPQATTTSSMKWMRSCTRSRISAMDLLSINLPKKAWVHGNGRRRGLALRSRYMNSLSCRAAIKMAPTSLRRRDRYSASYLANLSKTCIVTWCYNALISTSECREPKKMLCNRSAKWGIHAG